ncbi:hypothetical protein F5146DRAFT_570431 [Armillaria mellea]|nr:hypothetical protein F5146DRAFT_570431 [Armillaria mellea]
MHRSGRPRVPKRSYYYFLSRPSVIDLLDFAYDVGVGDSLSTDVLNKLIAEDNKDDEYIMDQLVSFVTGLPPRMETWNDCLFRKDARKTAEQNLAQFLLFGCGRCYDCTLIKGFFTANTPFHSVNAIAAVRTHVENQLNAISASKHGVKWETSKYGRPYTLHIQKPESMVAHGKYKQRQKQGLQMLAVLGDSPVQRRILGADFDSVYEAIAGKRAPLSPEPSVTSVVPL